MHRIAFPCGCAPHNSNLSYHLADSPPFPDGNWEISASMPGESWKDIIRPVFQLSCDRTPGSFIDEKESSICWHYRFCDSEYGEWQCRELQSHLTNVLKNTMPLRIVSSPKTVRHTNSRIVPPHFLPCGVDNTTLYGGGTHPGVLMTLLCKP